MWKVIEMNQSELDLKQRRLFFLQTVVSHWAATVDDKLEKPLLHKTGINNFKTFCLVSLNKTQLWLKVCWRIKSTLKAKYGKEETINVIFTESHKSFIFLASIPLSWSCVMLFESETDLIYFYLFCLWFDWRSIPSQFY